jgi:LPXTG-motif cell wall-anchored protein
MHGRTLLIAAVSFGVALTPAWTQPSDKKTELTVNETILIPGKELPPGKYVMKLLDSPSNRHIVQIWNEDQNQLQAMILAIPNQRLEPKSETVLSYWETPAGVPPALRAWFYPGDTFGQEFAYPREMAERIANTNNAAVPAYEGPDKEEYSEALQSREVERVTPAAGAGETAAGSAARERSTSAGRETVNDPTRDESRSVSGAARNEPALVAQNRPPQPAAQQPAPQNRPAAQQPAPAAQSQAPVSQADRQADQGQLPSELPATASPLPWIAFAGIGLAAAGGLLLRRRPSHSRR